MSADWVDPDKPRIDVLFAYGAGDRTIKHRDELEEHLRGLGINARVTPLLWQARNRSVPDDQRAWIKDRFPAHGKTSAFAGLLPYRAAIAALIDQGVGFLEEKGTKGKAAATGLRYFRNDVGGLAEAELGARIRGAYGRVTDGSLQVAADVFAYVRNASTYFDEVAPQIAAFGRDRSNGASGKVLVGLSLGGIMLVDVLSRMLRSTGRPGVDLLVTCGSQSPYLYAIDALPNLHLGDADARLFTPWVNVWNRNDFLSFPAVPAFGRFQEESRARFIRDYLSGNDDLFPEVHSGYFTARDGMVRAVIRMILEELGLQPEDRNSELNRDNIRRHQETLTGDSWFIGPDGQPVTPQGKPVEDRE